MMNLRLASLGADKRGAAVIELALVAPVLGLLVIGIVDISNAFSHKLALEQGAQRAIERIMQTTADDTVEATLKAEVVCQVNGTSGGICKTSPITTSNVTVNYRQECTTTGGALTTQTTTDVTTFDGYTCASATDTEARYIEVVVTDKYTPLFPIHFSAFNTSDGTYHLSATAGMRTE